MALGDNRVTRQVLAESLTGPIGERVRIVWKGNLKQISWDQDFLEPFRVGSPAGTYIGLGKTLSGLVHAARRFDDEADVERCVLDCIPRDGDRVLGDPVGNIAAIDDNPDLRVLVRVTKSLNAAGVVF